MKKQTSWKKGLKPSLKTRLFSSVIFCTKTDCWVWTASKISGKYGGYGRIRVNGLSEQATKVSYELFNGPIKKGLQMLHKCDNPSCINPDHLFPGTQSENMKDMHNKKRHSIKAKGEL